MIEKLMAIDHDQPCFIHPSTSLNLESLQRPQTLYERRQNKRKFYNNDVHMFDFCILGKAGAMEHSQSCRSHLHMKARLLVQ